MRKQSAVRRREIMDAALALFLEIGFEKTQMTGITKRINIAQGLVYHYFTSKTDVLYAVTDDLADQKLRAAEKKLSADKGSAAERIKTLAVILQKPDDYERLLAKLGSDPAINEYCLRKKYSVFAPLLRSLIEQGNADKSLNCAYPEESAEIIALALPNLAARDAYSQIVSRVLGIA